MLDDNSDSVHDVQLEGTGPVYPRDEAIRILAETRSVLAYNRRHRQSVAEGLRKDLRSYRKTVRTVLTMLVRRSKAADDKRLVGTAHQQEAVSAGGEFPEALNEWPRLSEQILQAIQGHPEGVSIVEIGNELGVDFRRLLGYTDKLLASGKIDQVQELFYPVGR
jgi:hypothetical protein